MKLIVNGEQMTDIEAATVQALLEHLKVQPGRVAVEVNLTIVKKAEYENYPLKDGDAVEIVNFVGGG